MNNDLVNRALEQAKTLQKTVGEAIDKGREQAHPLISDAVAKAGDLKDTLVKQAAEAGEKAQPQLHNALGHLNEFIKIGKTAMESGVAQAHQQLGPLADQLKKTVDNATAAMGKKPEDAAPK